VIAPAGTRHIAPGIGRPLPSQNRSPVLPALYADITGARQAVLRTAVRRPSTGCGGVQEGDRGFGAYGGTP